MKVTDSLMGSATELEQFSFSKLDCLERAQTWLQPAPAFVLDLSLQNGSRWKAPAFPSEVHATFRFQCYDALLFGPNMIASAQSGWLCEAENRVSQYIDFYNSTNFQQIFKGPKPLFTYESQSSRCKLDMRALDDDDVIHLEPPVFLSTPVEPDNWGRWLSTVVIKVERSKADEALKSRKFLCRTGKTWQRDLLEALEIPEDMIIEHDPGKTYKCTDIATLTFSAADLTPTEGEREIFRKISDQAVNAHTTYPKKIYVSRTSRSKLSPSYRVLLNEEALIAQLSEIGFTTIEPESLSFFEQAAIFASASVVVGLGGAGMFNTLFCRPKTKVVTIEAGPGFINLHSRLFAAAQLDYAIIFGMPDDINRQDRHQNWRIDVSKTVSAIKAFL